MLYIYTYLSAEQFEQNFLQMLQLFHVIKPFSDEGDKGLRASFRGRFLIVFKLSHGLVVFHADLYKIVYVVIISSPNNKIVRSLLRVRTKLKQTNTHIKKSIKYDKPTLRTEKPFSNLRKIQTDDI